MPLTSFSFYSFASTTGELHFPKEKQLENKSTVFLCYGLQVLLNILLLMGNRIIASFTTFIQLSLQYSLPQVAFKLSKKNHYQTHRIGKCVAYVWNTRVLLFLLHCKVVVVQLSAKLNNIKFSLVVLKKKKKHFIRFFFLFFPQIIKYSSA